MKKSVFTLTAILMAAFFNLSLAQTLESVLEKHFEAVGQDKLMAVESFEIDAKLSQMGMEMPMQMKIKKPNKFLVKMTMQGQEMTQAFDGENGWMIAPWVSPEPQALAGEQLEQAKDQTNMEGELYNYEQKGSTIDFKGKVNLDGNEAFKLTLNSKDGSEKDYYIDANTYLILKVKAEVSAQGQTVEVEQIMGDYQTTDGITMARKIETKSPMGSATILMEDVRFNTDIDDSIFKQPAK